MRERVFRHLKDHFIPHIGNGHHPHVLRHHILAGYSAIFILLKVLAVFIAASFPTASLYSSSITPANIIALTNATREALHLPLLKANALLGQAAQRKAADMLAKQYFAHRSPTGETAIDLINQSGYKSLYAGENLAVHFLTAEDVNSGWMLSPTHRANIVNPRYEDIGIGIINGDFEGEATQFVVQLFGKPIEQIDLPKNQATKELAQEQLPESTISHASVKPVAKGYQVRLDAPQAKTVHLALGQEQKPLQVETTGKNTDATSTFSGGIDINTDTLPPQGEILRAIVRKTSGETTDIPLAIVSPHAQTDDIYVFQKGKQEAKVLGFAVGDIQDGIHKTYFFFILFVAASFLLGLMTRSSRIRHLNITLHTLGVLLLGAILFAI